MGEWEKGMEVSRFRGVKGETSFLGGVKKKPNYLEMERQTDRKEKEAMSIFKKGPAKKKIRIRWTCSNRAHHEHRWKWTAWLCGRIQRFWPLTWGI